MLTPIQKRALHCIDVWVQTYGIPPTRQELAERMGLKSKSGAQRMIDQLVARGYLRRLSHLNRAIEIVRRPRVRYFRFDDEAKELVEWTPDEAS